jgi:hypothetical protein
MLLALTKKSINPLRDRLPNGATMDSTHTASLDIPELSATAAVAHVFPAATTNHSFQLDNYAMKGTLSLLQLTTSLFSTKLEKKS